MSARGLTFAVALCLGCTGGASLSPLPRGPDDAEPPHDLGWEGLADVQPASSDSGASPAIDASHGEDTTPDADPVLPPPEPRHAPFDVLTYNVRHVTEDDTGAYAWASRSPDVVQLIEKNDPDIFGVQEASSAVIQEDLKAAFGGVYDHYQPPGGSPKMIFFRRGRFAPLSGDLANDSGNVRLPNVYTENEPCFPNAGGRTAAWVRLRDLASNQSYFIINAHIAHGNCAAGREAAAQRLVEVIEQHAGDVAVIVIGDLNADPQNPAKDEDSTIDILEAGGANFGLYRSHRHSGDTTAQTATYNSSWKKASTSYSRLDYIFVSGGDLTTRHSIVDRSEFGGISPSDHFAVATTIRDAPFRPVAVLDANGDGEAPATMLDFADVDGDRCADKFSWNPTLQGGQPRVYLSNCDGTFGDAIADPQGASQSAATRFFFGDVNGDRCADRLASTPGLDAGRASLYLSNCDGTFAFAIATLHGEGSSPLTRYYLADVDADRCDDLAIWNPGAASGRVRMALSNCDGTFGAPTVGADGAASENDDAHFYFADVTGDGAAEKILWDPAAESGRTRIYRSNVDGTFSHLGDHPGGYSAVPSTRLYFADVNRDGHADKIFWRANFRQGRPQIYLGDENGFQGAPMMGNPGYSQSELTTYFFVDVDGSGAADQIYWRPTGFGGATRTYLSWN